MKDTEAYNNLFNCQIEDVNLFNQNDFDQNQNNFSFTSNYLSNSNDNELSVKEGQLNFVQNNDRKKNSFSKNSEESENDIVFIVKIKGKKLKNFDSFKDKFQKIVDKSASILELSEENQITLNFIQKNQTKSNNPIQSHQFFNNSNSSYRFIGVIFLIMS
jgi:hypothetical protein